MTRKPAADDASSAAHSIIRESDSDGKKSACSCSVVHLTAVGIRDSYCYRAGDDPSQSLADFECLGGHRRARSRASRRAALDGPAHA